MVSDLIVRRDIAERELEALCKRRMAALVALGGVELEMTQQMRHMMAQYGHSTRRLARLAGVSYTTIGRWLREEGE